MIHTFDAELPHGITLSCRACGEPGRPVLLFLHGFPEGAFVWDDMLEHFSRPSNGGWYCVAPNLRGYERSSAPVDVKAYRARHLLQDIAALTDRICADSPTPGRLAMLVAHDWGGALAWAFAAQHPQRLERLAILNAPHPAMFQRELAHSAAQQAASAYMLDLARPDTPARLMADDFAGLWPFFSELAVGGRPPAWLDEATRERYRAVWRHGLHGGCSYYAASPLRPPTATDPGASAVQLAPEAVTVRVPTLVIWGLGDTALPPTLLDGLAAYVPDLRIQRLPDCSHWLVHEQPARIAAMLADFLQMPA